MMMLLLGKKLLASTSCKSPLLPLSRCLSSSSPDLQPHFMEGFLINSCGMSPEKASQAARKLPRIKSPQDPDSVINFLKHWGFDDTHIRHLLSSYPPLLYCNVEKPLEPNMKTLLGLGFSRTELPSIIVGNPQLLINNNVGPRIDFWKTLFGNDIKKLGVVFKRSRNLFHCDVIGNITPKIAALKNHGLSDQQIQSLLLQGNTIFTRSTHSLESLLEWTVDLRVPVGSSMFVYCLHALSHNGRPCLNAKIELLKKYGWSENNFLSAFMKYPMFTHLSQENIQAKMEFLVGRAGCTPDYIVRHPSILRCSLEKRLMPRSHVLQILKAKRLTKIGLITITDLTDKMFLEKCIHRFEDKVPELLKIYNDACAGSLQFHPSTPSQ